MSAQENCSRFNDPSEYFNNISTWNNEKVVQWLQDLHLPQYIDNFRTNRINGFDLCHITHHELHTELKIFNLHERNLILKNIRENILKQCKINDHLVKINIKFKEKNVEIQFDNEFSVTIANLLNYIRDIFEIKVFTN